MYSTISVILIVILVIPNKVLSSQFFAMQYICTRA